MHRRSMGIAIIAGLLSLPPAISAAAESAEKVSVKPGETFSVTFTRQGDHLTHPMKAGPADAKSPLVKVRLAETTDSPIPPPREGATRPYLTVENTFDKPLRLRALVRFKGSPEWVEMKEDMDPIPDGDTFTRCWGFDTQVEEVMLCDFRLSDAPSR